MQQSYSLKFLIAVKRDSSRNCVHKQQILADRDGGILVKYQNYWVVLYLDNDEYGTRKITKCSDCCYEALGFVPNGGRVKQTLKTCDLCLQPGRKCLMLGADFQHKLVCIECFEGFGGRNI